MNNLNLKIETNQKEIIILQGEAEKVKAVLYTKFSGILSAPAEYLAKRLELLSPYLSVVEVDSEKSKITFRIYNKEQTAFDEIEGSLKESKYISLFGINQEKYYTDKELAKFLRKMSFFIPDAEKLKVLVDKLMKFSATVTTVLENSQDNRGNAKIMLDRKVETEIPSTIEIKIPIFEGYPDEELELQIGAEASTVGVKFFLESMELYPLLERLKATYIKLELEIFKDFPCPILIH